MARAIKNGEAETAEGEKRGRSEGGLGKGGSEGEVRRQDETEGTCEAGNLRPIAPLPGSRR